MIGFSSTISMMELGTNTNVCSNQCQTHDCVKDENCPMGLHPSAASFTRDCVLCLSCLKSCRHRAVRINARLPWEGMLARDKWEPSVALFAILLIALVLSVKIPAVKYSGHVLVERIDIFSGMAQSVREIAYNVIILVLVTSLMALCSGFPWSKRWKQNLLPAGHAYLFLGFAGFLNIYLREFVQNGHNVLPWIIALAGMGNIIPPAWVTPD